MQADGDRVDDLGVQQLYLDEGEAGGGDGGAHGRGGRPITAHLHAHKRRASCKQGHTEVTWRTQEDHIKMKKITLGVFIVLSMNIEDTETMCEMQMKCVCLL